MTSLASTSQATLHSEATLHSAATEVFKSLASFVPLQPDLGKIQNSLHGILKGKLSEGKRKQIENLYAAQATQIASDYYRKNPRLRYMLRAGFRCQEQPTLRPARHLCSAKHVLKLTGVEAGFIPVFRCKRKEGCLPFYTVHKSISTHMAGSHPGESFNLVPLGTFPRSQWNFADELRKRCIRTEEQHDRTRDLLTARLSELYLESDERFPDCSWVPTQFFRDIFAPENEGESDARLSSLISPPQNSTDVLRDSLSLPSQVYLRATCNVCQSLIPFSRDQGPNTGEKRKRSALDDEDNEHDAQRKKIPKEDNSLSPTRYEFTFDPLEHACLEPELVLTDEDFLWHLCRDPNDPDDDFY